ncbi:hypothetical protein BaRGS_00034543 [Batillaria attramentaria]|uniref:Uncharacterized protein n=1 Tax=Batillaria attramentaria TaxID=370345 RepID=A0ABD0JH79_9CAEN
MYQRGDSGWTTLPNNYRATERLIQISAHRIIWTRDHLATWELPASDQPNISLSDRKDRKVVLNQSLPGPDSRRLKGKRNGDLVAALTNHWWRLADSSPVCADPSAD